MSDTERPTCFDALTFGGQFLLWAIRLWAHQSAANPGSVSTVRKAFELADLREAYADFDAFLTMLSHASDDGIDIRPRRNMTMSADEARLLGVIATLQRGDMPTADRMLRAHVRPSGARLALDAGMRLAEAMRDVRMTVAPRDPLSNRAAAAGEAPSVARAPTSATLH